MENYSGQPFAAARAQTAEIDAGLRQYFLNVYNYMTSGLLLTALVAWFGYNSPAVASLFYNITPEGVLTGPTMLGWIVVFAPIGLALFLGMRIQAMSITTAKFTFFAYATLIGLSLMTVLYVYTGASVARTFLVTAITFGGMSLYGYSTKRNLTGIGNFLIMGVWGLLVASVVNIFMKSAAIDFVISAAGVLIFTGLTAYDTQRLKGIYYSVAGNAEMTAKTAVMGALNLYMDFINLFIMLLRFMGDRR